MLALLSRLGGIAGLGTALSLSACVWRAGSEPSSATTQAAAPTAARLPLLLQARPWKPGTYGEIIRERGLFQGCDIVDGADYCAFHANGWKYYAYRGGPTPGVLLDALDQIPVNTPLIFAGDAISYGDITVEVALGEVKEDPDGDVYADIRARLQGRWQSRDDPLAEIEIMGSEMRDTYNGQFRGLDFLQIGDSCEDAPPDAGPLLLRTTPENRDPPPLCYAIQSVDDQQLQLIYMGRGNTLSYRRLAFPPR